MINGEKSLGIIFKYLFDENKILWDLLIDNMIYFFNDNEYIFFK